MWPRSLPVRSQVAASVSCPTASAGPTGSHLAGDPAHRALYPSCALRQGKPASVASCLQPRNRGGHSCVMASPALVPDGLHGDRFPQAPLSVLLVLRGQRFSLLIGHVPQLFIGNVHPMHLHEHSRSLRGQGLLVNAIAMLMGRASSSCRMSAHSGPLPGLSADSEGVSFLISPPTRELQRVEECG